MKYFFKDVTGFFIAGIFGIMQFNASQLLVNDNDICVSCFDDMIS